MARAVEIRAAAFGRHIPQLAEMLSKVEAEDQRPDSLLLLAERKIDGQAIGSVRLQPNFNRPLRLQGETSRLDHLSAKRLVETTRLGVLDESAGSLVTVALVKAIFEICHAARVDYVIAGGRRSMLPLFRSWCYDPVEGGPVPISYGNNIPHWIFILPIHEVEERWRARSPSYYEFAARTEHPDIEIDYRLVEQTLHCA